MVYKKTCVNPDTLLSFPQELHRYVSDLTRSQVVDSIEIVSDLTRSARKRLQKVWKLPCYLSCRF